MWAALLFVLFGLGALLFVPAEVSLEVKRTRTFSLVLGLRWFVVRLRRELFTNVPKRKSRVEKVARRRMRLSARTFVSVVRVPGLSTLFRILLARLAASVRLIRFAGWLRLGLGDPADTGRMWALASSLVLLANRCPRVEFGLEPEFSGPCLHGVLSGTIRFYPFRFAYGIASTLFSATAIRVALAVLRTRPWKH
jgi:hypothetical protein